MTVTRRSLLNMMAKFGGVGAVYETLSIWGFLQPAPAAAKLALPPDAGKGISVAVLGAGIAGLCAAYELDRAGFEVVILEAQNRAGGRIMTLRKGDSFKELGDNPRQVCQYDEGLYFNAGAARIPHLHVHVIDYCRKFRVSLEPYIFTSRANLVHSATLGNGGTIPLRQADYDLQGHVAELLDHCVSKNGIDEPLSAADLDKLHQMLVKFGDLTKNEKAGKISWSYQNASARSGFSEMPGYGGFSGKPLTPMTLEEILRSNVWNNWIFREAVTFWQTSLLQPVGGMDMITHAFLGQPSAVRFGSIGHLIRYGAQVTEINIGDHSVALGFEQNGSKRMLQADYCVCAIPMPIFGTIKTNLPDTIMQAATEMPVIDVGKVGWQADRFWEINDQIFGGISWTDDLIDQIWYPSDGFLANKGILVGAFVRADAAVRFNAMPVDQRLQMARASGEKLHRGFSKWVDHGLAIGWANMEFAKHGWADQFDPRFGAIADILSRPQGRFKFAGDHTTFMPGWQEGAILSAWEAVKYIDRQVNPTSNRG